MVRPDFYHFEKVVRPKPVKSYDEIKGKHGTGEKVGRHMSKFKTGYMVNDMMYQGRRQESTSGGGLVWVKSYA